MCPPMEGCRERDRLALENWERWKRARREQSERLSRALSTEPGCLLINRDETAWDLRREKECLEDAQLIKDNICRCGETGCPMFWKTTEPQPTCGRNILSEVTFSPLKLTHENKKLSNLVEEGYVGQPKEILKEKGLLGHDCFEDSFTRWKKTPYYKERCAELEEEMKEVKNHVPQVDRLIVVGKKIIQKERVCNERLIPSIVVEEYSFQNPEEEDEAEAILSIGSFLVRSGGKGGLNWAVDLTGAALGESHARYFQMANRGQIAIGYTWRKRKPHSNPELPTAKEGPTRFFFDRGGGILLPGQSVEHTFWFRSRTPGVFGEVWDLVTKPSLPPIRFYLEGVASLASSKEKHENNEIDKYLTRLVEETAARELKETRLHGEPTGHKDKADIENRHSEKEIFEHANPSLYYDIETVKEVKKLHSRFFKEPWNLSMVDLCDALGEKLEEETDEYREETFRLYAKLLRKLQRKGINSGLTNSDWELFKYHLTYFLLCDAIAQMEKCLNYRSWGLQPPNAPPGTLEECEGCFDDNANTESSTKSSLIGTEKQDLENGSEDTKTQSSNILSEEESSNNLGERSLEKENEKKRSVKIKLTEKKAGKKLKTKQKDLKSRKRETPLKKETKSPKGRAETMAASEAKTEKEDEGYFYNGGDPAPYLKPRKAPPPWVRKHFLVFAKIQWERILGDAIDDVAALIDSINFHARGAEKSNIKFSKRMKQEKC